MGNADAVTKPVILIVDDQPENIRILSGLLQDDYTPIAATSGPKGVEIALSDNRPDLILLDIMMPEMDGYKVCQKLKDDERTRNIPVIFLTAKNQIKDETRGFEAGAVDFLTKPFHPERLEARVRAHLKISRRADGPGTGQYRNRKSKIDLILQNYETYLSAMQEQIDSAVDIYKNLMELTQSRFRFDMSWRQHSVSSLGGDFIDIRENGDTLNILIADVAGHDMGSSYHTILLKAFFEENFHRNSDGLTLFRCLNRHIIESGGEERMITALFVRIHYTDLVCEVVSAAQPWIILNSKSSALPFRLLESGGLPLGLHQDAAFVSKRFQLSPSDRLFIHTDGVNNASRLDTETGRQVKLSQEKFNDFLLKHSDTPIEETVDAVWDRLLRFCRGKPKDDILLFGMEIPGKAQ